MWRKRVVIVLLVVLLVMTTTTTTRVCGEPNDKDATENTAEHERLHVLSSSLSSSSSRLAAIRAIPDGTINLPLTYKDAYDVSLAERLFHTARGRNEPHNFEDALRRQEELETALFQQQQRQQQQQQQQQSTPPLLKRSNKQTTSMSSWYWLGGLVVVLGAATWASPTAVLAELQGTATQVLGLQVVSQMLAHVQTGAAAVRCANLVWMAHLLSLLVLWGHEPQQASLRRAWRQQLWPTVVKTTHKLVMAEVWTMLWKLMQEPWQWLWGEDPVTAAVVAKANEKESSSTTTTTHPTTCWWQDAVARTSKLLHKGTSKLVKAMIRKLVDDFVSTVLSQGVTWIKDVATSISSTTTYGT